MKATAKETRMSMSKKTYDYRDLVRIYVLTKCYEKAAPELRNYYARLYSRLSSFFGSDLDQMESISDAESDSFGDEQREPLD